MGRMRLTFAAALVISGTLHAEPIAFGPGDAPGTELEVVSRTVETHRAGARNPDASTLNTTLVARVERDARGRHVRVRLKQFGAESMVSDEPLMRIAGETELYLMEALTSVPLLLDIDDKGRVIGVADWDTTRRMLRQAAENRVAALSTEKPMLHPGAALPADVVAETDARIAHGFVDLISNMKPDDFIDRFCSEIAFLLLVSGERLEIGRSTERSMAVRNPADGSLSVAAYVLTLREVDAERTRALFDWKLLSDDAVLRGYLTSAFRRHQLDEDEIRRRVEATPVEWQATGNAEVDIASGQARRLQLRERIRIGEAEIVRDQDVSFSPVP